MYCPGRYGTTFGVNNSYIIVYMPQMNRSIFVCCPPAPTVQFLDYQDFFFFFRIQGCEITPQPCISAAITVQCTDTATPGKTFTLNAFLLQLVIQHHSLNTSYHLCYVTEVAFLYLGRQTFKLVVIHPCTSLFPASQPSSENR